MKALCFVLIVMALALPCLGQKKALEPVKVKIEASEWDKSLLLEKLNKHGPDHGWKLELADEGYAYRIVFATGQEKNSAWEFSTSRATVTVFGPKGNELFHFKRAGRGSDAGATNAVAKEIVKRLYQVRSQEAK